MGHSCVRMMAQMQKPTAECFMCVCCKIITQKSILPTKAAASAWAPLAGGGTPPTHTHTPPVSEAMAALKGTRRSVGVKNVECFVGKWEKLSYNCGKCGCLKISLAI